MSNESDILLQIKDLKISFHVFGAGLIPVVHGVDLTIHRGEMVGLVGESGSGKSVTAMSIMRLLEEPTAVLSGEILYYGEKSGQAVDIMKLRQGSKSLRALRGNDIAMIFQEPMRALSPVFTVGHQVAEAVRLHRNVTKKEARQISIDMLGTVGIPDPERRFREHPHELSGGQRQRVMIAIALVCQPQLLIADEPTTALDVTIQAQILELMNDLQKKLNLAIMLITHDLGIVAQTCSRVNVMYMGKIVESAGVEPLFATPKHPYTHGLLQSVPVPGRGHRQKLFAIKGTVPEPLDIPPGCAFGPRCELFQTGMCDSDKPVPITPVADGHWARCYRAEEV
ncbi:MAG: ABC transporter ATP-binding protein [Phycisphaerae bacterium]|nr:ABC transporter ATP-binding protein [Phycisphaerae bacterium]